MGKAVLIADLQARHPPMLHIGMVAVADVDRAPAAQLTFVAVVEKFEAVQIMQVPAQRAVFAVDLERVQRLVAAGIAGGLERCQRAIAETRQKCAGVVDRDLLDPAGQDVLALFDKSLGHGRNRGDGAIQPERGIDAMGEQVAGDAAAGDLGIEPPQACAALRQVLRYGPILQEFGAIMENPAQPALVDHVLGQCHRRNAAVIVPDHVGDARRLHRLGHFARFALVASKRFLAHHHLAGFGGGNGDFGMGIVGGRDVDQVDIAARDQLSPVGLKGIITPLVGKGFGTGLRSAANRL